MKKVLMYPFDQYMEPIIKQCSIQGEYVLEKIVSPRSLGYCGKEIYLDDQQRSLVVTKDFSEVIDNVDSFWIVEADTPIDYEMAILPKINLALEKSKEVIVLKNLSKQQNDELMEKGVKIPFLNNQQDDVKKYEGFEEKQFHIEVPVVAVIGVGENTGKFSTVVEMTNTLQNEGYTVGVISARSEGKLLGHHSFPFEMFNGTYQDTKVIAMFNAFIKNVEVQDKPDIIILEVPGAVLSMNNYFPGDYGLTAYKVFNAITPDVVICSLYEGEYDPRFYSEIMACTHYKFGIDINYFTMNDVCIDSSTTQELGEIKYLKVLSSLVDKALEKVPDRIAMYRVEEAIIRKLTNRIIEELSSIPNIQTS